MGRIVGPSENQIDSFLDDALHISKDRSKFRKSDKGKSGYLDDLIKDKDKKSVGSYMDKAVRICLQGIIVISPNTPTEHSLYLKLRKLFPGFEQCFHAYWNSSPPPRGGERKRARQTTGASVFMAYETKRNAIISKLCNEMIKPTLEGIGRFVVVTITENLQSPRWLVERRTLWRTSMVTASGVPRQFCVSLTDTDYDASWTPPDSAGFLTSFFDKLLRKL
jgi:hypothetical protein